MASPGTAQTTTSGWYGEKITVGSSDLTITQLGRMYLTGNTSTHTVKIVDASNGSDVMDGSVNIATSGGEAGMIQYVSLSTPVTLTHGHSYYIVSQESSSGDQWYDSSTVLTTTSAATIVGAASNTGSWTVGGTANRSWGPVDFRYVFVQSNTFNQQNEATGEGSATLTYDHNGSTTTDETGKQFVYDAWNRMHQVKDTLGNGSGSLETYTYDAIGRRLTEVVVGGNTTHLYYSSDWQVLEERLGSSSNASIQNVWGLGFVNELVLRDRDADANSGTGSLGKSSSGLEERLYVDQDANYNVTSVTNTSGVAQERYLYTPYGVVTFLDGSWNVIGSSAKGMVYLYQGGRRDTVTGFYNFQRRDNSTTLQGWIERDPIGTASNINLYSFDGSSPAAHVDPSGLIWEHVSAKTRAIASGKNYYYSLDGWIDNPAFVSSKIYNKMVGNEIHRFIDIPLYSKSWIQFVDTDIYVDSLSAGPYVTASLVWVTGVLSAVAWRFPMTAEITVPIAILTSMGAGITGSLWPAPTLKLKIVTSNPYFVFGAEHLERIFSFDLGKAYCSDPNNPLQRNGDWKALGAIWKYLYYYQTQMNSSDIYPTLDALQAWWNSQLPGIYSGGHYPGLYDYPFEKPPVITHY